jgi:hypothetical protein
MSTNSIAPEEPPYAVTSVADLLKAEDLHLTFNLHSAQQKLKCFDSHGNLLWTAAAGKSPMCESLAFPTRSVLGSLNILRTGYANDASFWRKCVWCSICDQAGRERLAKPANSEIDLRFVERGLWVEEWIHDLNMCKLSVYDLSANDFRRLQEAVRSAGTCYLTPHYFQTCSAASLKGTWRPWRR